MDRYGYIGVETLLNFCTNSKDHAVTPNDFMRMKRVRVPERKTGKWKMALTKDLIGFNTVCFRCSECNGMEYSTSPFCRMCGAKMEEGEQS